VNAPDRDPEVYEKERGEMRQESDAKLLKLKVTSNECKKEFADRGDKGHPIATLAFYGPDDKKASKAVLGIFASKGAEPQRTNGFGSRPRRTCVTTPSCRTPGLRLYGGKASEAFRLMGVRTKKASIIRLAKCVRRARSGAVLLAAGILSAPRENKTKRSKYHNYGN
jgi:hypothetical protein